MSDIVLDMKEHRLSTLSIEEAVDDGNITSYLKRFGMLYCLLLFLLGCNSSPTPEGLLIGVWEGNTDSTRIEFKFNQDRTCKISIVTFESDSINIAGDIEFDFTKVPISLTIRNIPQLTHPLHTIIEFVGEDGLRIAQFAPRWRIRPIVFNPRTTWNLKRRVNAG